MICPCKNLSNPCGLYLSHFSWMRSWVLPLTSQCHFCYVLVSKPDNKQPLFPTASPAEIEDYCKIHWLESLWNLCWAPSASGWTLPFMFHPHDSLAATVSAILGIHKVSAWPLQRLTRLTTVLEIVVVINFVEIMCSYYCSLHTFPQWRCTSLTLKRWLVVSSLWLNSHPYR